MLFGVTLFTFLIFHVVGGDPAYQLAGKNATPEQIDSIRESLGLNQSYITQYFEFLRQSFTFDWGVSWHTNQNINHLIVSGLGPSLSLTLPAFIFSYLLSLLIALYSTYAAQSLGDRVVTFVCLALMSISFLVYIISFQYYFAFHLGFFPINGWSENWSEQLNFLVLPWMIAVCVSLGPNILIFRSSLLDQIHQDYVRTARAKGLSSFSLYGHHVFSNALIPILTVAMMQIPFLITGSLLLEAFFGIPGLGSLLIQAIQTADFPLIKAFTVIGSILYVLFNLLADILYSLFDPRVRLS